MKETKSKKENDIAAIERRRQKQAAQNHQYGEVNEQVAPEPGKKHTLRPPTMTFFPHKESSGKNRLAPLGSSSRR